MNKLISKTKIETCDYTWNPCYGCLNSCKYCYAKKFAKRFAKSTSTNEAFYLLRNGMINQDDLRVILGIGKKIETKIRDFEPIFLESNFNKEFPQKTQKIFIGSMSEIRFWREEWLLKIFKKIEEYPQHIFQFLTKYPRVYRKIVSYTFPKNCWLGITITDNKEAWYSDFRIGPGNTDLIKFVNIEPILERIEPESLHHLEMDWVIIGAETGNRREKIIPKKEWIENIVDYCRRDKIPVYLKDSLKEIYPEKIREFPVPLSGEQKERKMIK